MSPRTIYLETARTFGRRAGFLLLLGAIVFVPIGFLDAVADRAGEIHVSHPGDLSSLSAAALLLGFLAQSATSLLGEVFYSGTVALKLAHAGHGRGPTLLEIARALSYGRLIAVDLVFALVVAAGLLLFVVPGVIAFTWFALAGPLVEIEGARTWSAFKRSRRLVRGRFWTVLAVLVPITLASEFLTNALLALSHGAFANALIGDWVGESLTNILLSPFYAVAAVLITLRLTAPVAGDSTARGEAATMLGR